jgi:hypothetical protein
LFRAALGLFEIVRVLVRFNHVPAAMEPMEIERHRRSPQCDRAGASESIWIADAHYDEEDPTAAYGGIDASGWSGWLGGPILHLIP